MKGKNKHILIVVSEFPPLPGGIGNHAYNLAKHLQKKGFYIEVITDQRSKENDENIFDDCLAFMVHRVSISKPRWFMYIRRIRLLFKHIKTANIVIASGKFSLWIVAFISFFFKQECIAIIHGTEVNFRNKIFKATTNIALHQFTKIIAVSNYTKSLVEHLNLKNLIVIPNGFDVEKWHNHKTDKVFLKGDPKLITVGNVTERKGQLNVIRQLPSLLTIYPDLHYHCVGIPTQQNAFLKIAETLNVVENITFHGRLKDKDLRATLEASDVFVMLSSSTESGDVEGFGIAVLEANYLGLPAIGAINCGIEDAISNKKSGILVNSSDKNAFVNALNEILNNKYEFSMNARFWALQHRWEVVIEPYVNEIEAL